MIRNVKKIIIRPDFLSQQIYCSNGAFSFLNETSPEELVSRPLPANALCIPTVHHFIRYMHVHICEQKISFFFFFLPGRKIVIATSTDLVTYHLYLYFAIERKLEKDILL